MKPFKSMTPVRWLRLAVVLVLTGVLSEFVALTHLTPPTFLLFLFVGVPCLALGFVIYIWYLIAVLRRKQAL